MTNYIINISNIYIAFITKYNNISPLIKVILMKIKNKIKILFLSIALSVINPIFAQELDITASLPSWTYRGAIEIKLQSTSKNSKTFYSYNPDWWPNDAYLYTWTLLLKKSTPLVFFTYINEEVESKIKINNYIIEYPNTIRLSKDATYENSKTNNLFLINEWKSAVDLSYWYIKNDLWKYEFPKWTIINGWAKLNITELNWSGYYSLFSANDEKKDFTQVIEIIKEIKTPKPIISEPEIKNDPTGENNSDIDIEVIPEDNTDTNVIETVENTWFVEVQKNEVSDTSLEEIKDNWNSSDNETSMLNEIKTSTRDSGSESSNGWIAVVVWTLIAAAWAWVGRKYILKK